MSNFQERLKELRTEKGLTMKQVANVVKVSEMAVSLWEKGTCAPSINAAKELAKLFNVTVGYLVGAED